MSGSSLDRPQLQRAIAEARLGRFDLLLVYCVDRLSRSVRGLAQILEDLDQANVVFRSATEPFDTGSPAGRMIALRRGWITSGSREDHNALTSVLIGPTLVEGRHSIEPSFVVPTQRFAFCQGWCAWQESNLLPHAPQACALSGELQARKVGSRGRAWIIQPTRELLLGTRAGLRLAPLATTCLADQRVVNLEEGALPGQRYGRRQRFGGRQLPCPKAARPRLEQRLRPVGVGHQAAVDQASLAQDGACPLGRRPAGV